MDYQWPTQKNKTITEKKVGKIVCNRITKGQEKPYVRFKRTDSKNARYILCPSSGVAIKPLW